MSFFKKLFGGKEETAKTKQVKSHPKEQQKIKRTITDFFEIDITNVPDDSFIEAEEDINTSGEKVQNYRKLLDKKECGIFDTIEVKVIGGNSKNVFLMTHEPEKVRMDSLKKLVDDLYMLYGVDEYNKAKFNAKDIEDYNSEDFYMLFGRSWLEYPKYKTPVRLSRDEHEVSLAIFGANDINNVK